jgi:hypothetical protein
LRAIRKKQTRRMGVAEILITTKEDLPGPDGDAFYTLS